jgi:hypothetical protein
MPKVQTIKVSEMPRASLLEDGTFLEMEFKGSGGERVALGFDPSALDAFVSQVLQITREARTRRATSAGHLALQPLAAVAGMAEPAVGGKAVLVGIRTDNGQLYPFALQAEQADELRNQLVGAIASARKQARQTRQ